MSNFEDTSLYSKGLEYYKKNQLDNSLSFLNKIKKKFKYDNDKFLPYKEYFDNS